VPSKLNRRSQQRLKRMLESLENINKFANRLRAEILEELVRRDQIEITHISGGSSFAVSRSGSRADSSSVERAVIAREQKGGTLYDPVRESVKRIERKIIDSEENLRQIHEIINAMDEVVERKKKITDSEPCEICVILPAVKTAMCIDCYKDWIDNGAPDRFRWKAYKRALVSSEGIPLVTEQPPARHQRSNT